MSESAYPQMELLKAEMGTSHADRSRALDRWQGPMISTRNNIEACLPYQVQRPNGTRYKRQARLAWLSAVLERPVKSGAELTNGQNWRIGYWFAGLQPRTGEPMSEDTEALASQREDEVFAWLIAEHETIMEAVYQSRNVPNGGASSQQS